MAACKRMELYAYLSSSTNLNSKWIKDLNMRPDTLNVMEEKVGNSSTYRHTKVLLEHDPIIQTFRPAFDK